MWQMLWDFVTLYYQAQSQLIQIQLRFFDRDSFNIIFYSLPLHTHCAALQYTHTQPLGSTVKAISSQYSSNFNGRSCSWDHMPKFFMIVWCVSERCLLANKNKSGWIRNKLGLSWAMLSTT